MISKSPLTSRLTLDTRAGRPSGGSISLNGHYRSVSSARSASGERVMIEIDMGDLRIGAGNYGSRVPIKRLRADPRRFEGSLLRKAHSAAWA